MLDRSRGLASASVLAFSLLLTVQPGSAQAPRWTAVRDLAIGTSEDGPAALTDVSDIALGRDGAVYVAQPQEQLVRVFDAAGRPRRTIGRRGRGPGEFTTVQDLGWRGDTLIVSDPASQRISGFTTSGQNVFTTSFVAANRFMPRAVLSNGRVLGNVLVSSEDINAGRVRFDEWRTAGRAPAPGRGAPFTRLPLNHHTAHVRLTIASGPIEGYFQQPFGDWDLVDIDPAGRWVVAVARPLPTVSNRGTYTVRRLSLSGGVAWRTAVPYVPLTLSSARLNDTIAAYTRMLTDVPGAAGLERQASATVRRALFTPPYVSVPSKVVAGRDGTTWVRGRSVSATVTWTVLGNSGAVIGQVELPTGLEVHAADASSVWGAVKDEDDVPFVHRFRIRRMR